MVKTSVTAPLRGIHDGLSLALVVTLAPSVMANVVGAEIPPGKQFSSSGCRFATANICYVALANLTAQSSTPPSKRMSTDPCAPGAAPLALGDGLPLALDAQAPAVVPLLP